MQGRSKWLREEPLERAEDSDDLGSEPIQTRDGDRERFGVARLSIAEGYVEGEVALHFHGTARGGLKTGDLCVVCQHIPAAETDLKVGHLQADDLHHVHG